MPDKPPTRAPKAANMLSGSTISDPPPDRTGDVAVVINGLNKHFGGAPALQDLSAQIRYGRLTGLVGPDGAGKTTLMHILTGLLVPSSGRATVAGFDVVADNDAFHVATGYMPQRFGLYEDLSVLENMRLYAPFRVMAADVTVSLLAPRPAVTQQQKTH